jgi:beta-aspartyl-peptidase (threonine type)
MGFGDHDPVTPARKRDWEDKKAHIDEVLGTKPDRGLRMRHFLKAHPEYAGGTVGAAAVDAQGILAAATSTGGVTMKLVGRVGDTPIPGAGNYASPHVAASATGTGEFVLRLLATRAISERIAAGASLADAMAAVLGDLKREFEADVGIIAVDRHGNPVAQHLTPAMPHAFFCGDGAVTMRMRVE